MLEVGDKVRVRSLTVPKGYSFTYNHGIGCIGKVIENNHNNDYRSVLVKFEEANSAYNQEHYYEDDLDLIKEKPIIAKIKRKFRKLMYELEEMEEREDGRIS